MSKKSTCRDCGYPFELTKSELLFYHRCFGNEPKRCKKCRQIQKEIRADTYYGIDEAFTNYVPTRPRRNRVHYAPHLVGGFR